MLAAFGWAAGVPPAEPFVAVVNTEACRDTVAQVFGASADIIVINLASFESNDLNADNHASFAPTLRRRAAFQGWYLIWFSLGTGQSTRSTQTGCGPQFALCLLEHGAVAGVAAGDTIFELLELLKVHA